MRCGNLNCLATGLIARHEVMLHDTTYRACDCRARRTRDSRFGTEKNVLE